MAAKSQAVADAVEGTVADRVEQVRSQAESAKEQTVERIRRVASELERMGDVLRTDDPVSAKIAERAGRSIDGLANYVSSTDARAMLNDTERLARRSPAVFYGGAFLLGLAAGRFLKSSRPEGSYERSYDRYDDYSRRDSFDDSDPGASDYSASDYSGDYDRASHGSSGRYTSERDWTPSSSGPGAERRSSTSQDRFRQNYDAAFGRDTSESGVPGVNTTGTTPGIGSANVSDEATRNRNGSEPNNGSQPGKGSTP